MPCSVALSGLARDCATSMGGIVEAYIANYDDVTAKTVTDGQVSAVTMATGKHFLRYTFRKGTGSMTSTLNVDAANGVNYVSTDLVLLFTRMETTKRIEMAALAVNELAVIVKDANGKYWYLGYDEPVTASAGDGQTGTARGDGNRYSITLQDTSASFPYEVDPTIIDGLLGE